MTQFGRALRMLIASIHAHSPQAKGRVERAHRTPQDRLVKEMRLGGIGDMAAGNAHLTEFMADFNRRFAVAPRNAADAHREVLHDARELDLILCEQHARKLGEEPGDQLRGSAASGDWTWQGLPAAGHRGDGVQGFRRRGDGAARPCAPVATLPPRKGRMPMPDPENGGDISTLR